jgi:MYXO-CTERM domain-containing protein
MNLRSLGIVAGLILSTEAYAADHEMHVDEVLLDGAGGAQFIELHDAFSEGLSNGPYTLRIYDTAGTMVDSIALTGLIAGASEYYTVGNAAAATAFSSVTFNGTLANALPNPGTACFVRSNAGKVHCVSWGCPATPVTTPPGSHSLMVPASGMTLARQGSDQMHVAVATPDAANGAGTVAAACPTPMVDAGVTPDSGGNNNNPDAGTGGGGDDDSGCCQSSTAGGTTSAALLSLVVLGTVTRRRRRP